MLVRDLMQRKVVEVREDLPITEVCDIFQQARVHGAPVVDAGGRLVGFVSQEDLLFGSMSRPATTQGARGRRASSAGRKPRPRNPIPIVREVMTSPPVSATEDTEVVDLCRMMWRLRIHHVPIVRDGRVTGIVSALDLCRAISQGEIRA